MLKSVNSFAGSSFWESNEDSVSWSLICAMEGERVVGEGFILNSNGRLECPFEACLTNCGTIS